jgi:hypothetical protein
VSLELRSFNFPVSTLLLHIFVFAKTNKNSYALRRVFDAFSCLFMTDVSIQPLD